MLFLFYTQKHTCTLHGSANIHNQS